MRKHPLRGGQDRSGNWDASCGQFWCRVEEGYFLEMAAHPSNPHRRTTMWPIPTSESWPAHHPHSSPQPQSQPLPAWPSHHHTTHILPPTASSPVASIPLWHTFTPWPQASTLGTWAFGTLGMSPFVPCHRVPTLPLSQAGHLSLSLTFSLPHGHSLVHQPHTHLHTATQPAPASLARPPPHHTHTLSHTHTYVPLVSPPHTQLSPATQPAPASLARPPPHHTHTLSHTRTYSLSPSRMHTSVCAQTGAHTRARTRSHPHTLAHNRLLMHYQA